MSDSCVVAMIQTMSSLDQTSGSHPYLQNLGRSSSRRPQTQCFKAIRHFLPNLADAWSQTMSKFVFHLGWVLEAILENKMNKHNCNCDALAICPEDWSRFESCFTESMWSLCGVHVRGQWQTMTNHCNEIGPCWSMLVDRDCWIFWGTTNMKILKATATVAFSMPCSQKLVPAFEKFISTKDWNAKLKNIGSPWERIDVGRFW